jgi:Htaa
MIPRLVLCAAVACAFPATAAAAQTATFTPARALTAQGVKAGAVAPARAGGGKVVFPVVSATRQGRLKLRSGTRSVTVSAAKWRVGKSTVSIFSVRATRVKLTAAGAKVIKKALKLKKAPSSTLGTLVVTTTPSSGGATTTPTSGGSTTTPTSGGGGTTTTTSPGGGTTTPSAPACQTATASGGPAALARPGTAIDLTAATITWHPRESFIQYINSGEGTSTCNGATSDAPSVRPGTSVPLTYDFHYVFKDGWYDPISQTGRVTFTGAVYFNYAGHGIRLGAVNPEIEIAGNASRGVFTTTNTGETTRRGVLENLDPAHAASTSTLASPYTYTQVPGTIPAGAGDSTFAGYYTAGDDFGWVTVSMTTP